MPQEIIYALNDHIDYHGQKRILINTGSNQNIIQIARKNHAVYSLYKSLIANDYVHYFHDGGISKLYKREHIGELFKRKDLRKFKSVFYTLDDPQGRKANDSIAKKILVLFTCMPPGETFDSHLVPHRMFPKFFDGIERNLVKNVYTMRIMDLNCSHGSHYVNTVNHKTYEQEIREAILSVMVKLDVSHENVVLYGASKGGAGALIHGSALDMKLLAVDPIVNIDEYNRQKDYHFLKDMRAHDLSGQINEALANCSDHRKYLICSHRVAFNFEQVKKITSDKLKIIDLDDPFITSHPEVSRNCVPEQLMILNMLLSDIR